MTVAFPHPVLNGELQLRLKELRVDGAVPGRDVVDAGVQVVGLYRLEETSWGELSLNLEIEHDPEDLADAREKFGDFQLSVVAFCRASNARRSFAVELEPTGRAAGVVELDRGCFRGKVELYAVLAGSADGFPRWLAESERWRIHFDEPDVLPIEGMLRVKWADFGDDDNAGIPPEARGESFYVAVLEQPPLIYLNSGFEGLSDLLSDDHSRPPAEQALRDAEYRRMAAAAWSEMFMSAIAGIEGDEDGSPIWPAEDWKRQVLDALLPRLYREASGVEEALAELWGELSEGMPALGGLLQVAISSQINASKSLRRDIGRVDS